MSRRLSHQQIAKAFNQMLQEVIDGTTPRPSMSEVETKFRTQVAEGETPDYGEEMAVKLEELADRSNF